MDAVEYLRAKARMTLANEDGACALGCHKCPIGKMNNGRNMYCQYFERLHPEDAVRTVKGWIDKHPVKTRQSEFLKMFPKARMEGKTVDIDPCQLDMRLRNSCGCKACHECREEYWLEEIDDEK